MLESPRRVEKPWGYELIWARSSTDNGYIGNVGVVTSSGYGDGNYPVYVDVNNDNRVVALHIYFDGLERQHPDV